MTQPHIRGFNRSTRIFLHWITPILVLCPIRDGLPTKALCDSGSKHTCGWKIQLVFTNRRTCTPEWLWSSCAMGSCRVSKRGELYKIPLDHKPSSYISSYIYPNFNIQVVDILHDHRPVHMNKSYLDHYHNGKDIPVEYNTWVSPIFVCSSNSYFSTLKCAWL